MTEPYEIKFYENYYIVTNYNDYDANKHFTLFYDLDVISFINTNGRLHFDEKYHKHKEAFFKFLHWVNKNNDKA